jgi:hypothetical protein
LAQSNASLARQYLKAVESLGPLKDVAAFYGPDVVFQEFPNRIAPQGRVRRAGDLSAAYQRAATPSVAELRGAENYGSRRRGGRRVGMDWSPRDSRDEFARGERDESVRRDVPHLPRGQDYFAAKLRLLSAIRRTTRSRRPGVITQDCSSGNSCHRSAVDCSHHAVTSERRDSDIFTATFGTSG